MRDNKDVVSTATVSTPSEEILRLQAEVVAHLMEAEQILCERYNVYDVKLEAEVTIDRFGNRAAHIFPMHREIVDNRLQRWTRIELSEYHSGGTYAAFNGGHRTYTPGQSAFSLSTVLKHGTKAAEEAKQAELAAQRKAAGLPN